MFYASFLRHNIYQFHVVCRYKVYGSVHRAVLPDEQVKLVVDKSTVEGVDGFYAQVADESQMEVFQAFREMSMAFTEYALTNKSEFEHYM